LDAEHKKGKSLFWGRGADNGIESVRHIPRLRKWKGDGEEKPEQSPERNQRHAKGPQQRTRRKQPEELDARKREKERPVAFPQRLAKPEKKKERPKRKGASQKG